MATRAAIFGLSGERLTREERRFFAEASPWGFILFERNCHSREQVRALTAELRNLLNRDDLPILIDEEGGRVQRLKPPTWRRRPPAAPFGALYHQNKEKARQAAFDHARLIAHDLHDLGITVDCAPCADLVFADADPIIGDRSFGDEVDPVVSLSAAIADGLLAGGVLPVIKHIPGHGRAGVDSHIALPRIGASRTELSRSDFAVFQGLRAYPLAMTAHVVFEDIDPDHCVTLSPKIVSGVIRQEIGFNGLLMSDDLSMKALSDGLGNLTDSALNAGCDLVLHCNGDLAEMEQIANRAPLLAGEARRRAGDALKHLRDPDAIGDPCVVERRVHLALKGVTQRT